MAVANATTEFQDEVAVLDDVLPPVSAMVVPIFPDAEIIDFTLPEHKPLGCTVEESLDPEEADGSSQVFVSSVVPGGFAELAGIQEGDVIVGVTGTFGALANVAGTGLEKIRSMVGAVIPNDPLQISVARGTDVMARHESALVDLCVLPTGSEQAVDDCVTAIHQMGWDDEDDEDDAAMPCDEDDSECLLENMWDMWAEDLPEQTKAKEEDVEEEDTAPKPAPWSSRSSPSGTYVRNPKTGKMENIG